MEVKVKGLIKESYEKILLQKINEKGGCASCADEIWDNLTFLAEEVQKFDEVKLYLPLQIKKMLAFVADPDYSVDFTVQETDEYCAVEAKVFWSGSTTAAGTGFVKRYLSQIFPADSMSPDERKAQIEATVRGLALSRAITDAGIGLHLYGDCFDFNESKLEESEAEKSLENSVKNKVPQIPSAEEKKAKALAAKAEKAKTETAAAVNVPKVTATAPTTETENNVSSEDIVEAKEAGKKPAVSTKNTMSIEDARKQVADKGTYAGHELGVIFDKKPLNLIWLINNGSAVSGAARVLVESDEDLKAKL